MTSPESVTGRQLAAIVAPTMPHALLAFDVDGVLAPIVEHADGSKLSPGVHSALDDLSMRTSVAILSGRSMESLERLFRFPPGVHVVGSHGLEVRGNAPVALDPDERTRFEHLAALGREAVDATGDGAWLEYKPASVVFHTRTADRDAAQESVEALVRRVETVDGAHVKPGHEVVELLCRSASKGVALLDLARGLERSPIVFLGDDVTDEDAFSTMSPADVSVRVGPGATVARYRLADTRDVTTFLDHLRTTS